MTTSLPLSFSLGYQMSPTQAVQLLKRGVELFLKKDFQKYLLFEDDEKILRKTIEPDLLAHVQGFSRSPGVELAKIIEVPCWSSLVYLQRLSPLENLGGKKDVVLTYLFIDEQLIPVEVLCHLKGIFPQVKISLITYSALSDRRLKSIFERNPSFSQFLPDTFEDLAQFLLTRIADKDLVHSAWQSFCVFASEEAGVTIHP
ncbi:MAG: hypothetical protein V4697_01535 [Patescibacteria group bacterium]